jgi:DNA-binding beta-propeller fold protein YncE
MHDHAQRRSVRLTASLVLAALVALPAAAGYRYQLADFAGPVRHDSPRLHADRHHDEIYTLYANEIRVFNRSGMEVYRFEADSRLGVVVDLAAEPGGDLLLLATGADQGHGLRGRLLMRCTYRGEPVEAVERRGWPDSLADLPVDRLFLQGERLVLVNMRQMRVIETGLDGTYLRDWDLGARLGIDESERETVQISGIAPGPGGSLLVTVPVLVKVFAVSPEGEVRSFGRSGSSPGLFGVVSGVATDEAGRLFVADRLRHAVMVFDEGFGFVEEFGYPGNRPENLSGPSDLVVDAQGKVYVAQRGGRGVSVFTPSNH